MRKYVQDRYSRQAHRLLGVVLLLCISAQYIQYMDGVKVLLQPQLEALLNDDHVNRCHLRILNVNNNWQVATFDNHESPTKKKLCESMDKNILQQSRLVQSISHDREQLTVRSSCM